MPHTARLPGSTSTCYTWIGLNDRFMTWSLSENGSYTPTKVSGDRNSGAGHMPLSSHAQENRSLHLRAFWFDAELSTLESAFPGSVNMETSSIKMASSFWLTTKASYRSDDWGLAHQPPRHFLSMPPAQNLSHAGVAFSGRVDR